MVSSPVHAATGVKKNPAHCGSPYQILQRNASDRTIGESALQPQAFANDGIFDTGPFALKLFNGCGLVATIMRPYSGRKLPAQICANARKNRWSGVKPSIAGGVGFPSNDFSRAACAIVRPPKSAMLSIGSSL